MDLLDDVCFVVSDYVLRMSTDVQGCWYVPNGDIC